MNVPLKIAQLLLEEGSNSLLEGSDAVKTELARAYLASIDWDIDVTFNMREFRDAITNGSNYRNVVINEVYAIAENEYADEIDDLIVRLKQGRAA